MPTLTIGDRNVAVDDSFLKMTSDEQNAAVEEIASSLGVKPSAGFDRNDGRFSEMRMSSAKALEGIPVLGAYVPNAGAAISALAHPLTGVGSEGATIGERYTKNLEQERAASKAFSEENPIQAGVSKAIGGALALAPVGATALGAKALGLAGDALLPMVARGAASGATIGAADAAARGESIGRGAAFGALHGSAAPVIGRAVGAGAQAIANRMIQTPEANAIASAADRLGVDFPKLAASDSLVTQRTGAALKELPYLGDPIVKASKNASEQMGRALEGVERGYGSGSALNAGDVAKTGLSDWITGKSGDVAKRLYGSVDNLVDPAVTRELSATRGMVGTIAAERQQAGLSGAGKAIDEVLDAVTRPGGLNYQGLKTLRTSVGEKLDNSLLPADISRAELKRIYGALSQDLKETVGAAGGPNAVRAFEKANNINTLISQRREALAKVIGTDASAAPERVMDRLIGFASGNSRADFQKLALARKAIGGEGWDEVSSAAVSRIGRDVDGNFSPERFLTAYGKLSPLGKQTLFGSTGKTELVQALEDIATLSRKAKDLAGYGNPSGTGRVLGGLSTVGAAFSHPHVVIPAAIGARSAAKALAAPIRPQPATVQAALKNATVRKLLEHVVGGATIGEAPSTAGLSSMLREKTAPLQQPVQ